MHEASEGASKRGSAVLQLQAHELGNETLQMEDFLVSRLESVLIKRRPVRDIRCEGCVHFAYQLNGKGLQYQAGGNAVAEKLVQLGSYFL